MRYSNYIGRVGTLAVALGIGAAVTSSPVVAWADSESDGTSSSERTTSTKTARPSAERDDRNVARDDDSGDVSDDTGPQTADDDADPAPTDSGDTDDDVLDADELSDGSSAEDDPIESSDIEADDRRDSRAAEPDEALADRAPISHHQKDAPADSSVAEAPTDADATLPAPTAPPAPVADVTVAVVEEPPVEEPEPNGATSVMSLLSSVLAPLGASDNEVPGDSPLAWGLLAFARRQVGQRSEETGAGLRTAALDTAAAADPNAAAPTGRAWVFSPGWSTGRVVGLVLGSDSDGDRLTYTAPTNTEKGTVAITSGGWFTYTPSDEARHTAAKTGATDEDRADSFVVTIDDGNGNLTEVEVNVEIRPANSRPNASGSIGLPNAETGAVNGIVVTEDSDGDTVTYRASTSDKGSVVFNDDGTFVFTPTDEAREAAANRSFWAFGARRDTFTVTVDDGHGGTDTVRFTVQIAAADNAAPVFDSVDERDPSAWTGRVSGRVFATDADGDRLSYAGSTVTEKGRVTVFSSGRFVYTPSSEARHAAAAVGATSAEKVDTFAVTVTDGFGGSLIVPVTITIAPRNAAPRISRASASRPDAETGVVDVAVSATDSDGDVLTFTASASTTKGTVVGNGNGSFTYTPTAAARRAAARDDATAADRTDTVTVTVTDGHGGIVTTTVTVSIAPSTSANSDPTGGAFSVDAPGANGIVTGTVTATDPDGDTLSYSGSGTTAKGTVVVEADGGFTYTPTAAARHAASAVGAPTSALTDSFTVTVADGLGGTLSVPVTVSIVGANSVPEASFSAGSPDPTTGVVAGIVTATDADGDTQTFSAPTLSAKGGEVTLNTTTGQFSYKPTDAARAQAAQTAGADTDTFTVTVSDGHGGIDTVTVSVTIAPPVVTTTETTPGTPASSVIVASDGTRYQVTSDYDPQSGLPNGFTRVSILDDDGRVITTSDDITGAMFSGSSAVVRPDGSLLLVTMNSSGNISYVSVVDAQGVVSEAGTVTGIAASPISLSDNGTAFFTAVEINTDDQGNPVGFAYRLARVSAANDTQIYDVNGLTVGLPVVTPDGSAYLLRYGSSVILAIAPDGTATSHFEQPIASATQLVLASDGNVYAAVTTTSGQAGNVTDVLMFSGSTLTVRQIPGVLGFGGAPMTVGPDGSVHVVTGAQTPTGIQFSLSRITATAIQTTTFEGNFTSFVRVAGDGTAYIQAQRFFGNNIVRELKIVRTDGTVISVTIPGQGAALQANGGNLVVAPDGTAYTSYISETGRFHIAVITADGAITTRALPVGVTVDQPVSISPTGAAFQRVSRVDPETGQSFVSVVAVATGAVSDEIPGLGAVSMGTDPIVFGPDGRGYVFAAQPSEDGGSPTTSVLVLRADGSTLDTFTAVGSVVAGLQPGGLTGFLPRLVTFAPDGTAYVTISPGPDVVGGVSEVWAVSAAGAVKVIEVAATQVVMVSVDLDGTAYLSAGYRDEATGDVVTKVHAIGDAPVVGVPGFVVDEVDSETGSVTGHFKLFGPKGQALSYQLDTSVSTEVGSLDVDSATGAWTFTPTQAAREAAYLTAGADVVPFAVIVTDGERSVTVNASAPIAELAPYQAPVINEAEPYTVAPGGADPSTGAISGEVNVTDDEVLTYYVVTQPDPTLGTVELNTQTGQWTFTPTARARVLAHALGQQSVEFTFAVAATDGTTATVPITITEPITGSAVAAVRLPSGANPVQSFIDPDTGAGYFFTYNEEQQTSQVAAIVERNGSYRIVADSPVSGVVIGTVTVGDTNYVVSVTFGAEYHTYLSRLGFDGLTPLGAAIPGEPLDFEGDLVTPRHFTAGGTTYLVTQSDTSDSGPAEVRVTVLTPDGLGWTAILPGGFQEVIMAGGRAFVRSQSGNYESGYETHLTLVGPEGVTPPTISMPGTMSRDPLVIGGTTYVLTIDDSELISRVSALTTDGAVYVGEVPGRVTGDPVMIGGTPYLLSEIGRWNSVETRRVYLSTFGPAALSMAGVGDPLAGYLSSGSGEFAGRLDIGGTTYVVVRTYDAETGIQTRLMRVSAEGLTPVGDGVHDTTESPDPIVVLVAGNPYVATWTGDATGHQVHLLAVGPSGLTPVGEPVHLVSTNYLAQARSFIVGDTVYLAAQTTRPGLSGWETYLLRVGPTGLALVGSPIAGELEDHGVDAAVVGDTAYLVTVTGNDESGYQTHLTAVQQDSAAPVDVVIPGRVIQTYGAPFPRLVSVGDTTYLMTVTGNYWDGDQHFYLTEIGPDGVTPPGVARPGIPDDEPLVIEGKTYVISIVRREVPEEGYWRADRTYLTVLEPGTPAVEHLIPGGIQRGPVAVGGTTYLMSTTVTGDGRDIEDYQTQLWEMTGYGPVRVAEPFPGPPNGFNHDIVLIGDTTYLTTAAGLWAVGVDTAQASQEF